MGIDVKSLNIQELMKKELTRKQFLQLLAVLIISVLGFNNLYSLLTKAGSTASTARLQSKHTDTSSGFGSSKFGI